MLVETKSSLTCPPTIDGVSVYGWDHPTISGVFAALPELPTEAGHIGAQLASQPTVVGVDSFFPSINYTNYIWLKNKAPEIYALFSPLKNEQLVIASDFITTAGIKSAEDNSRLSQGLIIGSLAVGTLFLGGMASHKVNRLHPPSPISRRGLLKSAALGIGATALAIGAGDILDNRIKNRLATIINSCQNSDLGLRLWSYLRSTSESTLSRTQVGIGKINSLPKEELSQRGLATPARKAYVWGFDHLHPSEQQSLSGATADYAATAQNIYHAEAAYLVAKETPRDAAIEDLVKLRLNLSNTVFYRVTRPNDAVGFQFARNDAGDILYQHPDILANLSPKPIAILNQFEQML